MIVLQFLVIGQARHERDLMEYGLLRNSLFAIRFLRGGDVGGTEIIGRPGCEADFLGAFHLGYPALVDDDLDGSETQGGYFAFDNIQP
jgi:hypothetical protein